MKQMKRYLATLTVLEHIYPCILTCCLSCSVLLLFPEHPGTMLLWAAGACVPMLAVRELWRRFGKKPLGILLSAAVCGLCLLLPGTLTGIVWCVCGAIAMFCCLALPHPEGKPVLSVPRPWWGLLPLLTYCVGRIADRVLLQQAAIVLALLFVLVFLLYVNFTRVLRSLRDNPGSAVSVESILRANRRTVAVFLAVFVLLLLLLPWMLEHLTGTADNPQRYDISYDGGFAQDETERETEYELHHVSSAPAEPIDVNLEPALVAGVAVVTAAILAFAVWAVYSLVNFLRDGERKHSRPEEKTFTVEKLRTEPEHRTDPGGKVSGWRRKIRRVYEKLLLSRTEKPEKLYPMSPAEQLPGGAEEALLCRLYEDARYSPAQCTREDYHRIRALAQKLAPGRGAK